MRERFEAEEVVNAQGGTIPPPSFLPFINIIIIIFFFLFAFQIFLVFIFQLTRIHIF